MAQLGFMCLIYCWSCTWKLVLNQYISLTKSPTAPSHETLAFIVKKKTLKTKNRINILTLLKQIKYEN